MNNLEWEQTPAIIKYPFWADDLNAFSQMAK